LLLLAEVDAVIVTLIRFTINIIYRYCRTTTTVVVVDIFD